MEDSLPDWINNELLTKCLNGTEKKEDIQVLNYSVSSVVPPGNNYGSFIIRINIEFRNNSQESEPGSVSLILKSEPTHGAVKEMLNSNNTADGYLQQSEYDFYYKFLPKAEKLTGTEFAPKSFFSPKNHVIILEDLKEKGFVMADRTKLLNFDHCKLYMEAAATMHAASFLVHKEDPNLIESMFTERIFSNDAPGCEMFKSMIKAGMKTFADSTDKIDRFRKYTQVIRDVSPLLWDTLVEIHKPSKVINTINQGDPWTTNMMFKYDETGNVSEVKLIDFQCLRYASPLNDLSFFIWSSANNYVRSHKIDELYEIYQQTFNSKLEQSQGHEPLTSAHLSDCVKRLSPMAIFVVAVFFPLLVHPDPIDFGKFFPKDGENSEEICLNYFKHYYNEKWCRDQVPLSLEHLEKAGVFDNLESLIK